MKQEKLFMVSILVENIAGVLSQIVRLFSRKGYNILSVSADVTDRPDITRITIVTYGDEQAADFILSQVRKQVLVISAKLLDRETCVQRELVMVKLRCETKEDRDEIIQIVNIFRGNIIDINHECLTVSVTGDLEKLEAFIRLVSQFEIMELVRSGLVALERGKTTILTEDEGDSRNG
jgi:acetolactate synthase-1/3 small subunit